VNSRIRKYFGRRNDRPTLTNGPVHPTHSCWSFVDLPGRAPPFFFLQRKSPDVRRLARNCRYVTFLQRECAQITGFPWRIQPRTTGRRHQFALPVSLGRERFLRDKHIVGVLFMTSQKSKSRNHNVTQRNRWGGLPNVAAKKPKQKFSAPYVSGPLTSQLVVGSAPTACGNCLTIRRSPAKEHVNAARRIKYSDEAICELDPFLAPIILLLPAPERACQPCA